MSQGHTKATSKSDFYYVILANNRMLQKISIHNIKSVITAADDLMLFLREFCFDIPFASPIGPSKPHMKNLVAESRSVLLSLIVAERGGTKVL